MTFIIINLCFGLIIYKIHPRKITSLLRFLEVLCETFHVKLLEQCLEHSISQVLAIIITSMTLENLHEKRTLRSLSLTVELGETVCCDEYEKAFIHFSSHMPEEEVHTVWEKRKPTKFCRFNQWIVEER